MRGCLLARLCACAIMHLRACSLASRCACVVVRLRACSLVCVCDCVIVRLYVCASAVLMRLCLCACVCALNLMCLRLCTCVVALSLVCLRLFVLSLIVRVVTSFPCLLPALLVLRALLALLATGVSDKVPDKEHLIARQERRRGNPKCLHWLL